MGKASAKAMTKAQLVAHVAEATGITKKQAVDVFNCISETAYKEAKKGFTIPGIGKLVMVSRAAGMRRNPRTQEPIKVPARKVLRFRVAKAAKDAILPAKK